MQTVINANTNANFNLNLNFLKELSIVFFHLIYLILQ